MRLFAALIPPEEVLDELADLLAPLRGSWPGLRWLSRESWHVTLAFYGELDAHGCAMLLPGLAEAARSPALELSLAGAGLFPPRNAARARLLWTGLRGDLSGLAGLAEAASTAGVNAGSAEEGHRAYHAHLTLARCKVPRDLRPLAERLDGFTGRPWTAGQVHLVLSHHGAPRYETLARWPLGER